MTNPDWLKGQTRTRIRIRLTNGETALVCPDCFIGLDGVTPPGIFEHYRNIEFIGLESLVSPTAQLQPN